MTASTPRPIPAPQQRRPEPLHYPEANYEPGQYPEGYYAPRSPRQGYPPSPRDSPGRRRADSGTAPTLLPGTTSPGQYKYPQPEGSPRASYRPPTPRTTSWEQRQYFSQPPPERTAYSAYSGASAGPQPRQALHPDEAYFDSSERYPPPRPRGQSDAYLSRPSHRPAQNDDWNTDTDTDREREHQRRERRRRRRMSEGLYDRDHDDKRRRDQGRRSRRDSKSSYNDKRPTLADSTLWAIGKAKDYLNQKI